MGVGQVAPVSSRASALSFYAYVVAGPSGGLFKINLAVEVRQFEDLKVNAKGDINPPGLIMLGAVALRDPFRFLIPGPPRARIYILMYALQAELCTASPRCNGSQRGEGVTN